MGRRTPVVPLLSASLRERSIRNAYSVSIMATRTKRSGQDRKRVSKQAHEIGYTGAKVAKKAGASRAEGKRAVKQAKKQTRTVSRRRWRSVQKRSRRSWRNRRANRLGTLTR